MSKLAWRDINWTLVQKRLSRQQRRVYKASLEGKRRTVHAIQRKIVGSLDSKLLAVRGVTTENRGHNTPGVDGVKALSHEEKIELAYGINLDGKTKAIRRTYIPRIGKKKVGLRPLGIPTIEDRAKQMLAKLALEPEWEALFEPNSYGFRPGRSCHDAIASIFLSLRGKTRFVLDADIHKCFDEIDHDKLLKKLNTFDQIENQIKAWLKADIMVGFEKGSNVVTECLEGTPQEGIISPLLANIALHGLENHIKDWYANSWYSVSGYDSQTGKRDRRRAIGFSRYADDFVITGPNYHDIVEIEKQVDIWLIEEAGLKLSKAKTRIVNSTEGFEFLGFQIISVNTRKSEEYKVSIRPSKESKSRIITRIRKLIQKNKSASSYALIVLLSSRIIGWANYFRYSECQVDFSKLDYIIFQQIRAWVFRRKSKGTRGRRKLKEKYFPSGKLYVFRGNNYKNNWILTGQTVDKHCKIKENFLPKMNWVASTQHIKVKGKSSPFDGNHLYWAQRTIKYSGFSNKISKLIQKQNGKCTICDVPFTPIDLIEADHIIPRIKGGLDKFSNLQALHKHCHIQKSLRDLSVSINDDYDVSQITSQLASRKGNLRREPDEGKLSRPDLKTSVGHK
jgi:RNA-directed DNA polymerase